MWAGGGCGVAGGADGFDIRQRRLPNGLTLPGAALILAGAVACGRGPARAGRGGGADGRLLVVHLLAPAAMGAGDVKLALGLGALTGAFGVDVWVLAAVGAPLLTARGRLLAAGAVRCRTARRCAWPARLAVLLVISVR